MSSTRTPTSRSARVNLDWIDSEQVEAEGAAKVLGKADAILVPGGFGKRGFEGKVLAAKYAREHGVPYFGICYGMHAAVVDFARHVAGLTDADSSENDRNTPNPVIALITEWTTATGEVEQRNDRSDLGGTMRLGSQECRLKAGTLARAMYGQDVMRERHRHRYEFNNRYRQTFEDLGLVISGKSMDDLLVEIVELPQQQHPWFLGCQAHASTRPCAPARSWRRCRRRHDAATRHPRGCHSRECGHDGIKNALNGKES